MRTHAEKADDFVRESNRIEGIHRDPSASEVEAFREFLDLPLVTVGELESLVDVFQPGARLRRTQQMNVTIGGHRPPRGGLLLITRLEEILGYANESEWSPFKTHCAYETLHPFMDGNGRSGRALWAWQMIHADIWPRLDLGFLHAFYYQTLSETRS